jgi:hypothetical protein
MAIIIKRNEAGNCITFEGSSNPVYWNACLSGEVHTEDSTLVNVVNDIKTSTNGVKEYEFFKIPYNLFRDADGNPFVDAAAVVSYIDINGNVTSPEFGAYKGEWDASQDFPNPTPNGGDWYFVSVDGNKNPNDVGGDDLTVSDGRSSYFIVNDVIKYNGSSWGHIKSQTVRVDAIENSALGAYSIYVDPDTSVPLGSQTGSNLKPFAVIQDAIDAVPTSGSIFIKGTNEISSELTWIDKSISFYGSANAVIKYTTYDSTNGNIISFEGDGTQLVEFNDIAFRNAGGYALFIKKTDICNLRNCEFFNNGWNGQGLHTVLPSSVSGVLGFDSSQVDLQSFYAGANTSNGGAVRLEECRVPMIRESRAVGNLRGFRLQDCGINGGGFVIENQANGNIESGIYLAAGSTYYGCQNITVAVNYSAYNANNGILCIGGLNNKFSQNEVNGNWNAGACFWGAANSTLRDCGLYDNNRSTYNGIGNVGDAKASIQINEAYNLLGTSITLNAAARFIAEILDTQVHYTGLGSNSSKVGLLITSGVGALSDNPKNIIKVDDVGFIGQDYAIDLSEVDVTNLRVSLGDNSYQSIGQKAVRPPLAGNYSELPFSNHVMEVPEVDVVVDTLKKTIALHEGVGGNAINVYYMNELQSILKSNSVDIIQKSSDKIQLRDCTLGNVYINGKVAGSNVNTMNDSLNGAFSMDLTEYKEFLESEVGIEADGNVATFYYIESPDGEFHYPLFKTQDEANAFDLANGGTGSGSSHSHTYDDDLSGTTWYMPDNESVMSGSSAPLNGVYGTSTNVIWNIQTTDDDANYAPTFTSITYNVQEGSAINIQYKAQGMTESFNITNVPSGYADNGFSIIGTAEDITNGYGQSVTHVLNVTKANNFDSVQGTITINVLANLSGNEFTLVDDNGTIKFTQDGGLSTLNFNTVTFNAGSTYKFYLDGNTLQTNDFVDIVDVNGNGITGNDGLTQSGGSGPGYTGSYLQYVIPSDVAPGKFIRFIDGDTSTQYTDIPLTLAGSTYTEEVTAIDLEGPAANQTGTNVMDAGAHGWISLDEQLSAGERLVLDNAFFTDFFSEVQGNNTVFAIGLKGDNWVNTREVNSNGAAASGGNAGSETFKGNLYIVGIWSGGASNLTMWVGANNQLGNSMYMNTSSTWNSACAFLEITNSGNNIRAGLGRNGNAGVSQGDESTVRYGDWNSYKGQTGEQGYGITTADVMMSFWTYNGGDIDGNEIDWTGLTEVSVPVAPTTQTSWTKAVDFSGSSQHVKQVSNSLFAQPLQMGGLANLVDLGTASQGDTSNNTSARPWATAVVFKSDGYSGNQMIWNQGEGSTDGDDNIFLNVTAAGHVNLGWGRAGAGNGYNQCRIANNISSSNWYGISIAHNGVRLGGGNASAANLADCFDIRLMSSADSFTSISSNLSVASNWVQTGYRMDRTVAGDFTIGGRGSGHSYRGKIASMVVTTLLQGGYTLAQMPEGTMVGEDQAKLMITDPIKWVDDYKVRLGSGNPNGLFRKSAERYATNYFTFAAAYQHTYVWLMGDGVNDSYVNGVRNYINTSDQNYSKLQFNSMSSDDIENVSINISN